MTINTVYLDAIVLIERLHRLFLDVVKVEIERLGIRDISNIQCFLLYNVGDEQLSVGELTQRGYYLGSNVTYNLKKMIENKYVAQVKSNRDRRSSYVYLTEKGKKMRKIIRKILSDHASVLERRGEDKGAFVEANNLLKNLETFWGTLLATSPRASVEKLIS